MIRTEDGHWEIAEGHDPPNLYEPPSTCLRCGIEVKSPNARDLHDGFHTRIGD